MALYVREWIRSFLDNQLFASQKTDLLLLPTLNKDLARIQEWCDHRCMILNPNKTKAFVVSRSKTVNPPHVDLVLSGVSIWASPNLNILGVKFDSRLTFEDHVLVSRVGTSIFRIGILRLVKCIFVDISVLLRCYYAFVLPSLEYWSPVWGSAIECHHQLLAHQVCSIARLCPDQTFLSLCHLRLVAALCMLYKVTSKSNHCLFSELHLLLSEFDLLELRLQLIH